MSSWCVHWKKNWVGGSSENEIWKHDSEGFSRFKLAEKGCSWIVPPKFAENGQLPFPRHIILRLSIFVFRFRFVAKKKTWEVSPRKFSHWKTFRSSPQVDRLADQRAGSHPPLTGHANPYWVDDSAAFAACPAGVFTHFRGASLTPWSGKFWWIFCWVHSW